MAEENESTNPQGQENSGQVPESQAASAAASSSSGTGESGTRGAESSQAQGTSSQAAGLPTDLPAEDDDEAWAQLPKWVRNLRSENASRRKKLQDAERDLNASKTRLKEFEDREKSDTDKMNDRLQELEAQVTTKNLEVRDLRVRLLAADMGVIDPEAAQRLIDWDDVGSEEGDLRQALKDLIEKRPWLKAPAPNASSGSNGSSQSSPTNPEKPRSEGQKITREYLATLTPEQTDELWKSGELKRALAEGKIAAN